MEIHCRPQPIILLLIHLSLIVNSAASLNSVCELSVADSRKVYNYSLASPTNKFPHGVLSEDGFYRVSVNETVLWFQLCDGMIFNHDPPRCLNCSDCGGPTRCGMACSAVVANDIEGYPVCTTLGHVSSTHIDVAGEIDPVLQTILSLYHKNKPDKGVIIKMSINGRTISDQDKDVKCSLSVSVLCDYRVQGPQSLEKSGACDYATVLRHPTGCAKVVYVHGRGWGWFGVLFMLSFCLLGGYLLAGTVYRYFALGVRGVDVVPNLEFWSSLPHRTQTAVTSLIRRFQGPSEGYRSSYSPVEF